MVFMYRCTFFQVLFSSGRRKNERQKKKKKKDQCNVVGRRKRHNFTAREREREAENEIIFLSFVKSLPVNKYVV